MLWGSGDFKKIEIFRSGYHVGKRVTIKHLQKSLHRLPQYAAQEAVLPVFTPASLAEALYEIKSRLSCLNKATE
jgi:hypothetical protein